eukprot:TRINITY_DN5845_c0_g1_i7.p1 TRINITY_DN5845_c0_g1~~TRINITY_DN5845_c0_g1_i7.p1  ORF type:complete len:205 (-),score=24.12 TRINITY_DN5845_c0_g1_i7:84-698(-)
MMTDGKGSILGIQALRNQTLAVVFFSTAAVTIAFSVIDLSSRKCGKVQIQLIFLAISMAWTFIHWIISLKGFNHLNFILGAEDYAKGIPEEEKEDQKYRITQAQTLLAEATIHHTIGIRGFFLCFCIAGWMWTPIVCFVVSLIACCFLYGSENLYVSKEAQPLLSFHHSNFDHLRFSNERIELQILEHIHLVSSPTRSRSHQDV